MSSNGVALINFGLWHALGVVSVFFADARAAGG